MGGGGGGITSWAHVFLSPFHHLVHIKHDFMCVGGGVPGGTRNLGGGHVLPWPFPEYPSALRTSPNGGLVH